MMPAALKITPQQAAGDALVAAGQMRTSQNGSSDLKLAFETAIDAAKQK